MSNLIAAGAYLRTLRDGRGLSRKAVADATGTSSSQIERIENGTQETRGSLLLALAKVVRGNFEHLTDLLLNPDATAEDGQRLADEWLAKPQIQQNAEELLSEYGPEIIEILDDLTRKPRLFDKWLGYGRGLKESDAGA